MKKWMGYLLIGLLSAGTASAAWWPFGSNRGETPPEQCDPPQHRMEHRAPEGRPPARRMNPEQMRKMQKIRENRQALMELGAAARAETDPVKKEALVAELRAKLNEAADKMHQMHQKRLAKAEKELEVLKQRAADAETNREQMIENQLQRILEGKPLGRPEGGRHSGDAPRKKQHRPKPQE